MQRDGGRLLRYKLRTISTIRHVTSPTALDSSSLLGRSTRHDARHDAAPLLHDLFVEVAEDVRVLAVQSQQITRAAGLRPCAAVARRPNTLPCASSR
jgi:hypothetical protein